MKSYPSIDGPSKAPNSHCIGFWKNDGSNLRFEWSKKRSWYKFGTRNCMIDSTHPEFGDGWDLFLNRYGDEIPKVFKDNKEFRNLESAIVFCEYFGENSFAGNHEKSDTKEVVLFDVNIHKKGFLLPHDFLKYFSHLPIPKVIYEGNFTKQFVKDVFENKYNLKEGVVAKGGSSQHELWMAKAKTKDWLDKLKALKIGNPDKYSKILSDNEKEQFILNEI